MNVIKFFITLTIVLLSVEILFANTPENTANKMVQRLERDITLNGEQKDGIKQRTLIYLNQVNSLNSSISVDSLVLIKTILYNEYNASLDSILTDSQKVELAKKRTERKKAFENTHQ